MKVTAGVIVQMISLHPQWKTLLPWPLLTLCKAIADGQHDLTFPLTVNGRRQQVPLSTLYCLEPDQVLLRSPTPSWHTWAMHTPHCAHGIPTNDVTNCGSDRRS